MAEHKKILETLQLLEEQLDKEMKGIKGLVTNNNHTTNSRVQYNSRVDSTTQSLNATNKQASSPPLEVLEMKSANNLKLITVLKKQNQQYLDLKKKIDEGLQSALIEQKLKLEAEIAKVKAEIREHKSQSVKLAKRLNSVSHDAEPENNKERIRMEEQLRVQSIKYTRLLQQSKKLKEELAAFPETPQVEIPEEMAAGGIIQQQQQQYKEYQGIVRLGDILSKRNSAQDGKKKRIYAQKLKMLQKCIENLGRLDREIATKEVEILAGRKGIQSIKNMVGHQSRLGAMGPTSSRTRSFTGGDQPTSGLRRATQSVTKLQPIHRYSRAD